MKMDMKNLHPPSKAQYAGLIIGLCPANENDVSHWLGANLKTALIVYLTLSLYLVD